MINAKTLVAAFPTALEWHVVCARRRGLENAQRMDELVSRLGIQLVPFDETLWSAARQGFDKYGQGQGGPLNFGDCFSYALAKSRNIPLLYKGNDFDATDVESAL